MSNETKGKGISEFAQHERIRKVKEQYEQLKADIEHGPKGPPTEWQVKKLAELAALTVELEKTEEKIDALKAEQTEVAAKLDRLVAPVADDFKLALAVDPSSPKTFAGGTHKSGFSYEPRETYPDAQFRKMKPWMNFATRQVQKHGAKAMIEWLSAAVRNVTDGKRRGKDDTNIGVAISYATVRAVIDRAADPHSWQEAFNSLGGRTLLAVSQRLHSELIGDSTERAAAEAVMELMADWHLALFERTGKKTYEISPGLAQRLAATELKGLKTDDLRLPYKSVYLVVPREANLQVMHSKYGPSRVIGCYIAEDAKGDMIENATMVTTSINPQPGYACRTWRYLFVGEAPQAAIEKNGADDMETLFTFVVRLPEGQTLDAALRVEEERVSAEHNKLVVGTSTQKVIEFYRNEWRKLFAWTMNAIIYATWPDADVEHVTLNKEARQLWDRIQKLPRGSKKKGVLQARHHELNPQHRIYLGRNTRVWTEADTHERSAHGTLTIRLQVQGHWKNQPYGEGRVYRKRIYIEPYWRGPEMGEVVSNPHVLISAVETPREHNNIDNSVTTGQTPQTVKGASNGK